ncbi:MAG: cyclic nucleotide-binding domain-containing protein [Alphaproteobacteria bacterium]
MRPGDYIGELSFLTRNPATATAIASTPLRTLVFDQNRLRAAIEDDGEMRRVVEAALNHTLASKLLRSNNSQLSVAPQSA